MVGLDLEHGDDAFGDIGDLRHRRIDPRSGPQQVAAF
jgi:hypothetical protein